MRIALNGRFYGAHRTGVQRFAIEIARRLLDRSTLFLPAGVEAPEFTPSDAPLERGRMHGHLWEQLEFPYQLRRSGCECALHMAGTAPVVTSGHVIVVHDLLPLTHAEWFTRSFRTWRWAVLRAAIPRASRVVTVSTSARDEILARFRVDEHRVIVAVQGAEPFDAPASASEVAEVRRRYELPERFLLAVGAGDPRKNIPFLGEVLTRWGDRAGPAPPLVVVGAPAPGLFTPEGGWPSGIDVRTVGHVGDQDLRALYTAAAVLCFPSLAEGFGRPPLEAIACGTPAVVAPYPAAREVLDGTGHITPLVPGAWVEALQGILGNGAPVPAGAGIAARFRWDAAAATILQACEEAVREGRCGRP